MQNVPWVFFNASHFRSTWTSAQPPFVCFLSPPPHEGSHTAHWTSSFPLRLEQLFCGVTWLTVCQLCCSQARMSDVRVHKHVPALYHTGWCLRLWSNELKLSRVFILTPQAIFQTHPSRSKAKSTPSTCQRVCWQCQERLAGSCVEWDYVHLSLVKALSPTPAHNCQERQTDRHTERERERGKEGAKELRKWVGERWSCDKQFGEWRREWAAKRRLGGKEKERLEADGEKRRWKEMSGIGDNEEVRVRQSGG